MSTDRPSLTARFAAAWRSLRGELPRAGADDTPRLRGRLAALEADVRERDERIETMGREFDLERRRGADETSAAGRAEFEGLLGQLAPFVSQLETMEHLAADGRELDAADVLKLFAKVRELLRAAGLEPLGGVGERGVFDSRVHHRMSGRDVRDGDPVRVRFVGYRVGDKIITKALVSREE